MRPETGSTFQIFSFLVRPVLNIFLLDRHRSPYRFVQQILYNNTIFARIILGSLTVFKSPEDEFSGVLNAVNRHLIIKLSVLSFSCVGATRRSTAPSSGDAIFTLRAQSGRVPPALRLALLLGTARAAGVHEASAALHQLRVAI